MIITQKNNKIIDTTLVFFLIATSGIEFFYLNELWIAFSLIFVLFVRIKRGLIKHFDSKFIIILVLFILWEFTQFVYFNKIRLRPLIGTFGWLTLAYLVIKTLNYNFFKTYINIITFLSVISLVFYSMYYVAPNIVLVLRDIGDEYFTLIPRDGDSYLFNKPN